MSKEEYIDILDGAFDAGMLIDENGGVLFSNSAAQELFEFDDARTGGYCDAYLTFWKYSVKEHKKHKRKKQNDDSHNVMFLSADGDEDEDEDEADDDFAHDTDDVGGGGDVLPWRQVMELLKGGDYPKAWAITGTTYTPPQKKKKPSEVLQAAVRKKDKPKPPRTRSFPGVVRAILLQDRNMMGFYYAMVFVRHSDTHDTIAQHHSSTIGSVAGTSASGSVGRVRRSTMVGGVSKDFDMASEPMVTVDKRGTIRSINRAAIIKFGLSSDLVGEHIVHGLSEEYDHGIDFAYTYATSNGNNRHKHNGNAPAMTVNAEGEIVSVNEEAVRNIPWCDEDLVGSHLSDIDTVGSNGHPNSSKLQASLIASAFVSGLASSHTQPKHNPPRHKTRFDIDAVLDKTQSPTIKHSKKLEESKHTSTTTTSDTTTSGSTRSTFLSMSRALLQFKSSRKTFLSRNKLEEEDSDEGDFYEMESEDDDDSLLQVFIADAVVKQRGGKANNNESETLTNYSDNMHRDSIMDAVAEASLDPLFQINERGTIYTVNHAAVRTFGYPRDEMIGNNISMVVGSEHAHNHDKYLQRFLATGVSRVIGKKRKLMARRRDGTEFPIELGVVEVDTFVGDERIFCGFVHDLSAITRKEHLTEGIIQASLDPIFVINESGRILNVNESASKHFGFTREEFLGGNISMAVGGGHAKSHDKYLLNFLNTGKSEIIGRRRRLPARHKDGKDFPIELAVVEIPTSADEARLFCGYVHNRSDLEEQKRIARAILETTEDAMLQTDDKGTIEMVNDPAAAMFGYSRDEFIGRNVRMIVSKEHADKHDMYMARYKKKGDARLVGKRREMKGRRKDGTEFPIELYIVEAKGSRQSKFCGFIRDLSGEAKPKQHMMANVAMTALDDVV